MFINKENLEKYRYENAMVLDFDLEIFRCIKMNCEHCVFLNPKTSICNIVGIPFNKKVEIITGKLINLEEEDERKEDI